MKNADADPDYYFRYGLKEVEHEGLCISGAGVSI